MEQEICRREVETVGRSYLIGIILSFSWIIISFMINFFIALGRGSILYMFEYGIYWIGFGNMILGAVLTIIFVFLHLLPTRKIALILTNKRIYLSISRKLFFKKTLTMFENHNLSKIVSYDFTKISKKRRSFSTLLLKTPASQVEFYVDEEFYNEFVVAVNNAC